MGQAKQRGSREQRIAESKGRLAEAPVVRELMNARRRYAEHWEVSSKHFFDAGYYDWMAGKVSGQQHVLEIGCGVGYSTLSLAQRGHSIVAIDENPSCLMAAKEKLEGRGHSVALHLRGTVNAASEQAYEVSYRQAACDTRVDILLIEGDILNDPWVVDWIRKTHRFDAVVCWLLGTHQYRPAEHRFEEYGADDQYGYRILVQNATYELADTVLRSEGVLHVVDRGGFVNDERLIDGLRQSHRDQASVTSLVVQDIDHIRYVEAGILGAMPMVWSPPDKPIDGLENSQQYPALISVTSRKPRSAPFANER